MSDTTHKSEQTVEVRLDGPELDPRSVWQALSMTPGVGVSISDSEGRLIFVNPTARLLFSGDEEIDYRGKTIADMHPPEFARERLALIQRVLKEKRPLSISHIYHGRRIHSTTWPIADPRPPFGRVIVVSRDCSQHDISSELDRKLPEFPTEYIDLGDLNVLSNRELEVLVMIGHGLTVPEVASRLHRSPKTIERHKAAIANKLGAHRQADIVSLVTTIGLNLDDLKLKRLNRK